MSFGLQTTTVGLGSVLLHKPIEKLPWNVLQEPVKNDILVLHGVDPFSRPDDS
jgi:hypothetical protein